MSEPGWLKTISNHAVISKKELLEWLGVTSNQLRIMTFEQGFPPPRIGSYKSRASKVRLSSASRWRVGEVRAWLEGSARLAKELSAPLSAEGKRVGHVWRGRQAVVFDGAGAFANSDKAQAQLDEEIAAAGGLEAWRAAEGAK